MAYACASIKSYIVTVSFDAVVYIEVTYPSYKADKSQYRSGNEPLISLITFSIICQVITKVMIQVGQEGTGCNPEDHHYYTE